MKLASFEEFLDEISNENIADEFAKIALAELAKITDWDNIDDVVCAIAKGSADSSFAFTFRVLRRYHEWLQGQI